MSKLELSILAGAESKEWLVQVSQIADRIEKAAKTICEAVVGKAAPTLADVTSLTDDEDGFEEKPAKGKRGRKPKAKTASFDEDEEEVTAIGADEDEEDVQEESSDDEDFEEKAPAKVKKAIKNASFDDEDEEELEDEEEEKAPAKKAGKAKAKITMDDVNDACMARAVRTNRAEVLGILKTKFKVKSVTDLDPQQYGDVIKAMQGK